MARKLSSISPDWWDYTTLDADIIDAAARLTLETLASGSVSTPGTDLGRALENALQMLGQGNQWEARAALCAALAGERGVNPRRRRDLMVKEAVALGQLARGDEAARVALHVAIDPQAAADERCFAWSIVAAARAAASEG